MKFTLFSISFSIATTFAHSHIECSDYQADGNCSGYARYYTYNKQGYIGTNKSRDRNYVVSSGTQTCPTQPSADPAYSAQFPMASVEAGQNITLYWPPRGHTQQPSSAVSIYCSTIPGVQNPETGKESYLSLVGTMSYDHCVMTDVSWGTCTGSFQTPKSWKVGEMYTCQWVWVLSGSTYVDCMEYKVVSPNSSSSSVPSYPLQSSQSLSPPPTTSTAIGSSATPNSRQVEHEDTAVSGDTVSAHSLNAALPVLRILA